VAGHRESAAHRRVRDAIEGRPGAASLAAWLTAVDEACAEAGTDAGALALVAAEVPTEAPTDGEAPADGGADGGDVAAVLAFWRRIAARHGEPWLRVRRAEAELAAGDGRTALDLYLGACEDATELALDESDRVEPLATAAGGEALFRWQLALLRAYLDHVPDDEDWIRERYSELLDAYRDQPERLARLYELGARIREMEATGELPQTMVARPPRKPPPAR
jgi:hypothetical protein